MNKRKVPKRLQREFIGLTNKILSIQSSGNLPEVAVAYLFRCIIR